MATVASLYSSHRSWALSLVGEDGSDEDRLTALVALWKAAREYQGGGFKRFAQPQIEEALAREAV